MKVIDNLTATAGLSEIGHGNITSQFALFSKNKSQTITPFVKCKDFLGDVFWAEETKQNAKIYGFKWDLGQDQGELKEELHYMVLRKQLNGSNASIADCTKEEVENIKILLNKFETSLGFIKSDTELSESGKEVVVSYDKKWTEIPYVWSAFLLLLRIGFKYDGKSNIYDYYKDDKNYLSCNDAMYMKTVRDTLLDLENGYIDKLQNYSLYKTIGEMHGNSGVVAWTKNYTKPKVAKTEVKK